MIRRFGRKEALVSLVTPAVCYSLAGFAIGYAMWPHFYYVKNETVIVLGLFALWRYGWQMINYVRSAIYALVYYPRLCKRVVELDEDQRFPERLYFVIPSYKEEPWVTVESLQSVLSNLATIPSKATIIIATGSDRDDAVINAVFRAHPTSQKVELVLQRQQHGKRIAMGHALRAVARRYQDEANSVTVFMDGDSYLEPHCLNKTVPFFARFRDLGAVTTNEIAYIHTRSQWYKDWFNLKFGQRHVLFQSHALSNRVLTLTGRFSILRTSVVVKEDFIRLIEQDVLVHWRHGKFRFLMGDDKSSWFYLLKHRWKMLYIPDVTCCSLESRDASFLSISMSLPYRWYGNTLRNNARALALGWRTTGRFIWLAILDQKLSMWTALVGLVGATILSFSKSFIYLPFYLAWVLLVRVIQMSVIALRGHPVSMLTIPLMLYNQWVGAVIKIRANFHLSDQRWAKGKDRQDSSHDVRGVDHPLARWMPSYMMMMSYGMFVFTLLLTEGAISMPDLTPLRASPAKVVHAAQHGIVADDGRDDALALQEVIDRVAGHRGITIQLPRGQLDLHRPVRLASHVRLRGHGPEHTRLVSHISRPHTAVLDLRGRRGPRIAGLARASAAGDRQLQLTESGGLRRGDLILVRTPNDERFFEEIDARVWRREYPYLRHVIAEVTAVAGSRVTLAHPLGLAFDRSRTEVYRLDPVAGVGLEGFTLRQLVPGAEPRSVRGRFENLHPDHAVDAISARYAAHCIIRDIHVHQAGRHPLAFDNVYGCRAERLRIAGAWNKGTGGHGYVKLARSFHSSFSDSEVYDIRHVVLQWSSAFNSLARLTLGVDLNLHGGYTHDNEARGIRFEIPDWHPWRGLTRTPNDAHWAPPDGVNRIDLR